MTVSGRPATLCEAFQRTAATDPCAVAVRSRGGTHSITWREYATQVRRVAAGLAALGVRRGDAVALMMANRIEFYPLDVGAQHLGATSFSLYNTLSAEQLADLLPKTGAVVLICEERYVDRIKASGAAVEQIVCIDGGPAGSMPAAEMLARGDPDFDLAAAWRAVQPDDVATLIYTSGTTAEPKCVEITHANLLFEAFALDAVLGIRFGDRITSFLPSAHIADRMSALYTPEVFGVQVTVVSDPSAILTALPEVRPTIWAAVSPVWEKLKTTIEYKVATEPDDVKRHELERALSVATKRAAAADGRGEVPENVTARCAADELALSKVRADLGLDQLRWAVSGDAPIPRETVGFFAGLGIPITEVWGMSELTCIASVSAPQHARAGSVGKLLPGLEGRIADDDEFLVRGPLVMKGYRNEPAMTAEAIDNDGWLHTGDILRRDADGYLRVVDRKADLIVNAAGTVMSPAQIEDTIKAACPLIGTIVVIGDGRPYNTALIVLGEDSASRYPAGCGPPSAAAADLAADAAMISKIAAEVATGNAKLSKAEQIRRFRVLSTFWQPGGDELTLTLKLKRRVIAQKYAADIQQLYAADLAPSVHQPIGSVPGGM